MTAVVGWPAANALTVPETPPSSWNRGSFGLQTSTDYFMSSANYGEGRGSYEKLVNGNKWTSFENQIKMRYGVTPTLSFYAGTGLNGSTATDNNVQKTNSNATALFAGVDFLLARRWWRVVPEIEAGYAFDQAKAGQTAPLTSDGAAYANLGVFMFKPYRYLRFESYLGFHFPGEDLAKRFMYRLGAEVAMFGAFTVGGGVQGYESVLADGTSNVQRKITQASADATSARFWAYNAALLEANAWLGLRFDKSFGVRLGYAKTLNGVRSAEGQSILLSLYYNSPGQPQRAIGAPTVSVGPVPIAPKARTNEFRTEPEPNDPELFDQNSDSLDTTERLFDHRN